MKLTWQQFFGKEKEVVHSFKYTYQGYYLSALIMACLAIAGYSLYFI